MIFKIEVLHKEYYGIRHSVYNSNSMVYLDPDELFWELCTANENEFEEYQKAIEKYNGFEIENDYIVFNNIMECQSFIDNVLIPNVMAKELLGEIK